MLKASQDAPSETAGKRYFQWNLHSPQKRIATVGELLEQFYFPPLYGSAPYPSRKPASSFTPKPTGTVVKIAVVDGKTL